VRDKPDLRIVHPLTNKQAVRSTPSYFSISVGIGRGINFFDTAVNYTEGGSEKILGQSLKSFDAKLDGRIG
jgi:aryl-alcohol dehydrogenase-like predicted oxidoreductase